MQQQEQTRYRHLRVILTDEEIQRKGEELARLEMEAEQVKSDASAAAKGFKGMLEGLTTAIKSLSRDVNAKSEWRDVEVKDWPMIEEGIVITRRCDTFEEISRRAMTAEERQAKLPFDGEDVGDTSPVTASGNGKSESKGAADGKRKSRKQAAKQPSV